ncbi:magnesium transporter MRS2 homolog, mitochondrial [Thunnus albacares]|uniref:magnesium transporter MRS2 homolog, mitochondrial n=1 Tax=Thunnus maccoyii TaxID=8240 RepID=UPI001C4DA431|nr:magnesium transporter MRS2 homolog, mitochondrial [Thunnus maccoyii]XP_042280792.1 magnesium transporter MRS2 homolog, mitochondrial [Thunnus maccoyii]XP_044215550.1 magnesium transporter MRS2 homolog, mitochondrial [Thunnus albacares]XP_044215551.1 magnesium transporter MRS2 homolog, mitochondrial [Thunnus albacares]
MKLHRVLLSGCMNCSRMYLPFSGNLSSVGPFSSTVDGYRTLILCGARTVLYPLKYTVPLGQRKLGLNSRSYSHVVSNSLHCSQTLPESRCQLRRSQSTPTRKKNLLQAGATLPVSLIRHRMTEAPLSSVVPTFVVMKFDQEGNVTSFEKRKTELCQELSLQARDLRFQHSTSLTARNNCIIIRMESLKAIVTTQCLLVLDFRGLGLERWLVLELPPQLTSQTHSLPFEFRALEAILQHKVNTLQAKLNEVEPVILDILESLVDPKILSADRSKLHILLQNSKSLSELETDIKVFKDSLLKILDEDEIIEELCLTKWTDPRVFEESSLGIDHAEEMELLLENCYMQAEELGNKARELKGLIDDSESVIFINLDSHRNVMMRLSLQLTMGTFSLSLFGLIGVAFGMNLESSFEEDARIFWLITGFMFLGSGLIWRRLLSFLGRHLEPSVPPLIPPVWKRSLKASDAKSGLR